MQVKRSKNLCTSAFVFGTVVLHVYGCRFDRTLDARELEFWNHYEIDNTEAFIEVLRGPTMATMDKQLVLATMCLGELY
jgi:hypothetical protein